MGRTEALRSLHGLSVGDAVGQARMHAYIGMVRKPTPHGWPWTDDTHMALSVVETLDRHGRIDPDALAAAFARRYQEDPLRGYAGGAVELLDRVHAGEHWRDVSQSLFGGAGSYGNGGAMRAAPIGAWFAGDPALSAEQADVSAAITHAHPEGRAGAIAVAVAAALIAAPAAPRGAPLLLAVCEHVPASRVGESIRTAAGLSPDDPKHAARVLGTGTEVAAFDTVPFALWVAAHASSFEDAILRATFVAGDSDTLGAIVGGLVVLNRPRIPLQWELAREPLPAGFAIPA